MPQVSRSMQIALVAVLLFAAVWFLALRPKPSNGGDAAPAPAPTAQEAPAAPGTEGLTGAVEQAGDAAATANRDAERAEQRDAEAGGASGGAQAPAAGDGGGSSASAGGKAGASKSKRGAVRAAGAAAPVRRALRQRKAIVLAFVDPRTADARAVRDELNHVSRFRGRAVTLAVPIAALSRYAFITREVAVTVAPTIVIVAPNRTATTIVGFADRAEIEQRLADALAAKRR